MKKIAVLVLFVACASCGGGGGTPDSSVAPDSSAGTYVPAGWTATPYLSDTPIRTFTAIGAGTEPGVDYAGVIETDVGTIVVDLTEVQTPTTVGSFVWLARNHFFDGVAFHRVIPGFVAQAGDPNTVSMPRSAWGLGGPGYMFGLEIDPTLRFDSAGVFGMARTMDPGSNGSQFFITLVATPTLDGQYTVFGRVIEGMSVLALIASGEPPATPTRMIRVSIVQR